MKKIFKTIILVVLLVVMSLSLFACGEDDSVEVKKSALKSTYTYSNTIGADKTLVLTDSLFLAKDQPGKYLLTTVWPMRQDATNGTNQFSYKMDQRLKLKDDFMYIYDYTIEIKNPNDWGGRVGYVSVQMIGTFTYIDDTNEDGIYQVKLSNPTAGKQEIFSFDVTGSGSYGYSMHQKPDAVFDLGFLATLDHYAFDKYTCGREVFVNQLEKSLDDNVFFYDIMDLLSIYCKY